MPGIHNGNLFVECMNLLCYLVLLKLLHMEHHGSQIFFAHVIQFRRRKLLHGIPPVRFITRIIPQNSFFFQYLLVISGTFTMCFSALFSEWSA